MYRILMRLHSYCFRERALLHRWLLICFRNIIGNRHFLTDAITMFQVGALAPLTPNNGYLHFLGKLWVVGESEQLMSLLFPPAFSLCIGKTQQGSSVLFLTLLLVPLSTSRLALWVSGWQLQTDDVLAFAKLTSCCPAQVTWLMSTSNWRVSI